MIIQPQCRKRNCKHFQGIRSDGGEENERPYCKAFPNGIPDVIAYGDNPHTEQYPGDRGIRYEPKE